MSYGSSLRDEAMVLETLTTHEPTHMKLRNW
jgi:hypothetical protein